MPWHELGMRGCLCHGPTMVEVGAGLEMQQELLPRRAEGQQSQQWLQPEPEPLGVAREQGYACWIYGPSHDVFMVGMRQLQMLPSPALHGTAAPCSASWCRQGGGS